jgi:hypothetical protein
MKIAALVHLAGMNAAVMRRRAERRDRVDTDAIMRAGIDIPGALVAACALQGPRLNFRIACRALSCVGDQNLSALYETPKRRVQVEAGGVDFLQSPLLNAIEEPRTKSGQ